MSKALVVLSGGQDSTTCAAIARRDFQEVHGITFDYGQRHAIEIESAKAIARSLNLTSHEIIEVSSILQSTSPLVSENQLEQYQNAEELPGGIEPTFVPGRNALFLVLAINRAVALGINDIFVGVCQSDYGGYPDCRQTFIDAMAIAMGEGISGRSDAFKIHTPLMDLDKAGSIKLAVEVLGNRFEEVFEHTHTCYAGVKGGCGKCHACILRDRGFKEAGIDDPIWKFRGEN